MRARLTLPAILLAAVTVGLTGCDSGDSGEKKTKVTAKPQNEESAAPKKLQRPTETTQSRRQTRAIFTSQDNPTTNAGRGEPSVDDQFRPAAWVFIDGQGGNFVERDGQAQLEWIIEGPTSATPTFRVEALESLVGSPKDFSCLLRTVSSSDGSDIYYAIKADDGTFELGKEYSLLNPGENFTIRNGLTRDVVAEIAPLAPGQYLIASAVGKPDSENRVLAVSHFTVAAD